MLFSSSQSTYHWMGHSAVESSLSSPVKTRMCLFTCPQNHKHTLLLSSAPSGNTGAAAPGSVCLFPSVLSLCTSQRLLCSSLSSAWQWNTVTPIWGVPWRQNTAVWLSHFPAIQHPACQHFFHLVLPTAPLSQTLPFTRLLLPLSLFSSLPSLTLPEDGSVKDKGQTKSQHPCEHLFCIARSGAPFYVWFLCQRQGNATRSRERMACCEASRTPLLD